MAGNACLAGDGSTTRALTLRVSKWSGCARPVGHWVLSHSPSLSPYRESARSVFFSRLSTPPSSVHREVGRATKCVELKGTCTAKAIRTNLGAMVRPEVSVNSLCDNIEHLGNAAHGTRSGSGPTFATEGEQLEIISSKHELGVTG